MFSPDIFVGLADFTSFTPLIELTLLLSHLPVENAVHFFAAEAIRTVPISSHLIPITAGWSETV